MQGLRWDSLCPAEVRTEHLPITTPELLGPRQETVDCLKLMTAHVSGWAPCCFLFGCFHRRFKRLLLGEQ